MATTWTRSALSSSWRHAQLQLALVRKRFADRVRGIFDALPTVLAKRAAKHGFAGLPAWDREFQDALDDATDLMLAHVGDLIGDARDNFRRALAAMPAEDALELLLSWLQGLQIAEQWQIDDLLARFRRGQWDGTIRPEDAARMVADLAFPPPSRQEVEDALRDALPGGLDWDRRLRSWAQPLRGQIFAQLVDGLANGENVSQLEDRLRPITGPLAYKAWRIANTEAGKVMMRDYLSRTQAAGDLLAGHQIVAVRDERTRPEHALRHGTIYWRQPSGEYRSDQGDLMHDLPDAPNCRCILLPVLEPSPAKGMASIRNADRQVVADPLSYEDWWQNASDAEKIKAVGAKRYQTMLQALAVENRAPTWLDFVADDGTRLLTPAEIAAEHPGLRALRTMELRRRAVERSIAFRDVYQRLQLADPLEVPRIVLTQQRLAPSIRRSALVWAFQRVAGIAGPEGRAELANRMAWSARRPKPTSDAIAEAQRRRRFVERTIHSSKNFRDTVQDMLAEGNWSATSPEGQELEQARLEAVDYVGLRYPVEALFVDEPANLQGFVVDLRLSQQRNQAGVPYDWLVAQGCHLLSRLCGPKARTALDRLRGGSGLQFIYNHALPRYVAAHYLQGTIENRELKDLTVVVHEMGHALEEALAHSLGQRAVDYYRAATHGAARTNSAWGAVKHRTDGRRWGHPYMGRDYLGEGIYGTELSSVVLEILTGALAGQGDSKDKAGDLLLYHSDLVQLVLEEIR